MSDGTIRSDGENRILTPRPNQMPNPVFVYPVGGVPAPAQSMTIGGGTAPGAFFFHAFIWTPDA